MSTKVTRPDLRRAIVITLLVALFIAAMPNLEDFVTGFFDAMSEY